MDSRPSRAAVRVGWSFTQDSLAQSVMCSGGQQTSRDCTAHVRRASILLRPVRAARRRGLPADCLPGALPAPRLVRRRDPRPGNAANAIRCPADSPRGWPGTAGATAGCRRSSDESTPGGLRAERDSRADRCLAGGCRIRQGLALEGGEPNTREAGPPCEAARARRRRVAPDVPDAAPAQGTGEPRSGDSGEAGCCNSLWHRCLGVC